MQMKKLLALILSIVTCITLVISSSATEIDVNNSSNNLPVTLNAEASSFSVTLPTSLPINVSSDGEGTVSDACRIINNSSGPIEIKSVALNTKNDWKLVEYDNDLVSEATGSKKFGFKLNEVEFGTDGAVDMSTFEISPGGGFKSLT